MWTYKATDQSPAAVATVFAASQFDPPREAENVRGSWRGAWYRGQFNLVDGTREYLITGDCGLWTVTPLEAN